jgi:c-di-GMP-binding flagellar brake protein YcgR
MSAESARAAKARSERRQRRHARYRVEFPVILTLLAQGERQRFQAHCRDLSVAGIGMLIAEELTPGEVAALSFSLPGSPDPWEIRAVLRHRRGYHYGFEFLSLNDEQGRILGRYLPTLEREDSDFGTAMRRE